MRPCRDDRPVTCPFKKKGSAWATGEHSGIDFGTPTGDPVYAMWAGTITNKSWGSAYGTHVVINHDRLPDGKPGLWAIYAHLKSKSVSSGQRVTAGQLIGYSNNTGNSSGPHLHVEIQPQSGWVRGSYLDPQPWIDAQTGGTTMDEYKTLQPGTALTVGTSYVRFSADWNPTTSGLQHAKRYSKLTNVKFATGKTVGSLRFKCVRTNPDDPTFYHDEVIAKDALDSDGETLKSFSSFEKGDRNRNLYWMVKCVGGLTACTITATRYVGFAVQD